MGDKPHIKIKTADQIGVTDVAGTVIKGGEIQSVPTSDTTTLTQEMAQALEQSIDTQPTPAATTPKVDSKPTPSKKKQP